MLTFDKIKIVTDISNITHLNKCLFKTISQGEYIKGYRYSQKSPYTLIIEINNDKSELVIEFSAKVLLDKYPQLINKDSIGDCFDNINTLGICTLNADAILNNSQVVKCDITKDFKGEIKEIKNYIKQNISNYRKWSAEYHQGSGGIIVKKTANTDAKRFVVYDKGNEIMLRHNSAFLSSLADKQSMLDQFKDKVRFEINCKSIRMTKELLQVSNNDLISVLNSEANPFKQIIDEALTPQSGLLPDVNLRSYERYLLVKECDFDMERISERVRSLISSNTSLTKSLEPYRQICQQYNCLAPASHQIRESLIA